VVEVPVPGADDDTSGTAALLETARILAGRPQPATIVFASFTGEEAGLLGSREFVRRAVADKMRIVGARNNDMVDLQAASSSGGGAWVTWTPSPEKGVTSYVVTYGPASNPEAQQVRVTQASANVSKRATER
jgi:Zn-dependent M28 family amino/carboxypeptidase